MESPNLVKVVAAFVAGVVIALGSALIYVRVSEMVHPPAMAVARSENDVTPPEVVNQAPETRALPDTSAAPETSAAISRPASQQSSSPPTPVLSPVQRAKKPILKWLVHRQAPVSPHKQQPKIAMPQLAELRPPTVAVKYDLPQAVAAQITVPVSDPAPASDEVAQAPMTAAAPVPQPHVITLLAGTPLAVRLSEPLSTDHNYTGDTFRATLDAPIIIDGFIIADKGSKVLGRVVTSERAGNFNGTADLTLTLTEINTTDGQRIQVDTSSFNRRGPTNTGNDAATIAGGAALGAIIGAVAGGGKGAAIGAGVGGAAGSGVVFATRGKAVNLPVEARLTFRLAGDLTITEKLN